jgi:hypothetical protein
VALRNELEREQVSKGEIDGAIFPKKPTHPLCRGDGDFRRKITISAGLEAHGIQTRITPAPSERLS